MGTRRNKEDQVAYQKAYQKAYQERNREKQKSYMDEWHKKNRDRRLASMGEYYSSRKSEIAAKGKAYRENNKEAIKARKKKWNQENPEKYAEMNRKARLKRIDAVKACAKEYNKSHLADRMKRNKERLVTDIQYRLRTRLRHRMVTAIKLQYGKKSYKTKELIGCEIGFLLGYLESKFNPGMSWKNWSRSGWHIDHIIPCAAFDLTDPEQQKTCFHYTNLQPLWAYENAAKSDFVGGKRISSLRKVKLTPERNCSHFLGDGNVA